MRPLPPELLRSFLVVAQTGSFTAASELVNLSQSTVSQHIRRLEELLDRALFERDTRKVRLTESGEALRRYASRILELMDEAVMSVCGPPLAGTVRLGLSEDFASTRLTDTLAQFMKRNPEVALAIVTGLSGELFDAFDEGKHDLVFAKRIAGSRRGRVVRSEPLLWCTGPGSPFTGREPTLSLALHPEPSVSRQRVLEALENAGRPYRIAVTSSSVAALRAATAAGIGIAAFCGYVIPDGLIALASDLPPLGNLDYTVERHSSVSRATLALEATLVAAASDL
ncbi:LysR family transcriptional regulator [Robbsia andropogonis]|uniref:LysR family transcriptional regulator n=1 Tax=Robbsia andropogonis TaxID=28092 RepID=A0A0F5JZB4_9BURK|nr:LysR substrate-binding domain-containing protein [Robbsia andropogonis]KKB62969.1 LysR family transcriptional regulator [Robbsia andropogonis]